MSVCSLLASVDDTPQASCMPGIAMYMHAPPPHHAKALITLTTLRELLLGLLAVVVVANVIAISPPSGMFLR